MLKLKSFKLISLHFLGKLEADDAPLSLVYHYFGELYNHYIDNEGIQEKVKKRLDFLMTDSIGLAYILTPVHAAKGNYFGEDKIDIIGSAREYALKLDPATAEKVSEEMFAFVTKMSSMTPKREETVFKMSAKTYWSAIGRQQFPSLFNIAKSIIEMICSSATSERTWSTFKFIHTRLRNRLTNDRVKKLVFIYTNCVLLDDIDKNDYILENGAIINETDCQEPDEDDQNDSNISSV